MKFRLQIQHTTHGRQAGSHINLKKIGYGQDDAAIAGSEHSIESLQMAFTHDRPAPARWRVENPNVRDPHGEIIVEAVLEFREGVFRRKNFDTNVRGAV